MKTLRISFIVLSLLICTPSIPLQAAVIYNTPIEKPNTKKKTQFRKKKKLRRKKRKSQSKKHLALNQNNRSPEARKSLTYFILTSSAIAIAVALFIISLPFWFASPAIIGIVLMLFSIAFLIAAIVFLVNGIMYFNKARALRKAAKN